MAKELLLHAVLKIFESDQFERNDMMKQYQDIHNFIEANIKVDEIPESMILFDQVTEQIKHYNMVFDFILFPEQGDTRDRNIMQYVKGILDSNEFALTCLRGESNLFSLSFVQYNLGAPWNQTVMNLDSSRQSQRSLKSESSINRRVIRIRDLMDDQQRREQSRLQRESSELRSFKSENEHSSVHSSSNPIGRLQEEIKEEISSASAKSITN